MNSKIVNWFAKVLPSKVIDDSVGFSDEEMKEIFLFVDSNLNMNSEQILSYLMLFPRSPKPRYAYFNYVAKLTNPLNEVGGSQRKKSYWLVRGWPEQEAQSFVSDIQSKNSPRTTKYWIARGMTEVEAKAKVKEVQSSNAFKMHQVIKENGTGHLMTSWSTKYWISKGMTEDEAKAKVKGIQKSNGDKSAQCTDMEKRERSPWCLEFWLKRGKGIEEYEKMMGERFAYQSKSATKFFSKLALHFPGSVLYFGEKEFGKYIPNHGYVKYDYVDLNRKLVIEYDGVYWHSSEDAKRADSIKEDFIKGLGFKVLRVKDSEDQEDENLVEKLATKIKEEYENIESC